MQIGNAALGHATREVPSALPPSILYPVMENTSTERYWVHYRQNRIMTFLTLRYTGAIDI